MQNHLYLLWMELLFVRRNKGGIFKGQGEESPIVHDRSTNAGYSLWTQAHQ
jgi:hypothetical protein